MSDETKVEITWMEKENRRKLEPVLFDTQDDIDRRREELIAEIEGKFAQRVFRETLFSIRWSLS